MHPKTHSQLIATCRYNKGKVQFDNYSKYYKDDIDEKKSLFKVN